MKQLLVAKSRFLVPSILGLATLIACGTPPAEEVVGSEETVEAIEPYEPEEVVPTVAHAILTPAEGMTVAATVTFTEVEGGVEVRGTVTGAEPGAHGFHLHEVGDCSSADFKSSGGHFNPAETDHAGPEDALRHAGDWGNLEVDDQGEGDLVLVTDLLTVGAGENSVVGRAVVLHGGEDDLESQPSGAAGPRIACGVVGLGLVPEASEGEDLANAASAATAH